jgi:hypothetical protein
MNPSLTALISASFGFDPSESRHHFEVDIARGGDAPYYSYSMAGDFISQLQDCQIKDALNASLSQTREAKLFTRIQS